MSDASKVYVCPDSNNSLAETMALMNTGANSWNNNPFMYLIWLAFFGGNGFGWGNREGDQYTSRQIAQLQDTINTNHNNDLAMQAINGNRLALSELAGNLNVGVTALNSAIGSIKGAIDLVGAHNSISAEKVVNSVLLGNKDLVQQIAQCCCENKQLITTMGYEGQLRDQSNTCAITGRIDQLANSVQTGFATSAFETQAQTNQISRDMQSNTQTIIDKISALQTTAMQDKINDLTAQLTAANSRAERAAELAPIYNQLSAIKSAQPATTTVQYPQLTVFPSYLTTAASAGFYGGGFWN